MSARHREGILSIALAQELQFELTLRQIYVIGLWVKADGKNSGGIVDRGRRWQHGLQWSRLNAVGVLTKTTS
jgi:hypothetical protein